MIGKRPIHLITVPIVLNEALRPIEAHGTIQNMRRIRPALMSITKLREMMLIVEGQPAHPITKLALRFTALAAMRPGSIAKAEWCEFISLPWMDQDPDYPTPMWSIPGSHMKESRSFLVPLSPQAVDVLSEPSPIWWTPRVSS